MFSKLKIFTVSLILVLASVTIVFAADGVDDNGNPNDPLINEDANACFGGGALEGKCDTDWEWTCGWHLIRYNEGVITADEFPLECSSLLPQELQPDCNARNDFYSLEPFSPFGSVPVPGILANDNCSTVVSYSAVTTIQGTFLSLTLNPNGSFTYEVFEPATIFTFTYTTENGSTATVRVEHDMNLDFPDGPGGCDGPCIPR